MPEQGSGSPVDEGFVTGNAEELLQNRDLIRSHAPDVVVVMSSDHVYRLDYTEVVDEHLARGAECTIVTTEVGLEDAHHHATVQSDENGKVTGCWARAWTCSSRPGRSPPTSPTASPLGQPGSRGEHSLVSGGCMVSGRVSNSVLGPGVIVKREAEVRDNVLFADVVVEPDATVDWAIVDSGVTVGTGSSVGGPNPDSEVTDDRLTLVGRDSRIAAGSAVPVGSRLEPGSTT